MGSRGPLPKPTVLKILEGNPGKRPINLHEPKPRAGIGDPIEEFHPEALAEFNRLKEEGERLGVLTLADRSAFLAYCAEWSRYLRAIRYLKEHGEVYEEPDGYGNVKRRAHPEVKVAKECLTQMRLLGHELGLSPAARGPLQVKVSNDEDLDLD